MAATTDLDSDLSCILPSVQDVLSAFKSSGSFDDLRQSCLEEIQVNGVYLDHEKRLRQLCDDRLSSTCFKTAPATKNELRNILREIITEELSSSEIQKGLESMVSCVVKRREDKIERIISDSIQALSRERKPESQEATTLLQTPSVESVKSDVKDNSVSKTAPQETALDLLDSFGVSTSATDNRKKLKAPKTATTTRNAYCGVHPSDLGKKSSSTVTISNASSESVPEPTGGEEYLSDSELTCNVGEIERKESSQKKKKPHFPLSSGEHNNDVYMDDIRPPQTGPLHKDSIREVVSGNPSGGDNKEDANVENCSPKMAVDDSGSCLSDDSVDVSEVKGSNLKMNEVQSKGNSSSHPQRKRHVSSSEGEPQGERVRAKRSRPAVVTTHHAGDRGPLKTKRRGQRLDS